MIAIPNMDKPKSCWGCFAEYDTIICQILEERIPTDGNHPDCPLIDIVTCGECICYRGDHNYCANDYFARENGFCSYGERRSE